MLKLEEKGEGNTVVLHCIARDYRRRDKGHLRTAMHVSHRFGCLEAATEDETETNPVCLC